MIDNILWFLSLAPSALVYNYTLACLLDVPRKKTYAALLSFLSLSFSAFCHVCPVLPERQYINTGVQLLLIFGGAFVFGRMTKRLCLLASAIITVVIFLPELAGIYFYLHLSSDPQDPSDYLALLSHPSALLFLRLFYFVLVSLLCVLTLRLWDRFIKKTRLDILHYYLLFPLSQAILLVISVLFIERHAKGAVSTGYSLALLLAILLCVVADVFLFRSIKQLMEKAAAEERAGWFDYLLEQQELYYEQYQADLEDASRIRHDIRNQLQTAYTLMEQHDGPGASAILNGVSDQLEQHPDYCPNRLLNALLSVKGNLFTQAGLLFQFDCALPELLPFSDVALCSVLTCLLDSAYHLATQCTPPQVPIHFSAQLTDKALTLSCQAPSLSETPQESNPFSAMELSILQETVSQLHGTLEVQQKNNSTLLHVVLPQANEKITA